MKRATKKILSAVLVLIMLLTAMPLVFAKGETYETGDIIQFGSYPQSEVKDETLIAELNALAPEWAEWTSYGYYSGTGRSGTMTQGDWMRYTDMSHKDSKYRAVKFTQFRPSHTCDPFGNTNQNANGYSTNRVYWFKFEPVNWRVLDPTTGLIMCETIIDSQPYSNFIYWNGSKGHDGTDLCFNDSLYTTYASDYETSSIRQWLNTDFYNTAFTSIEKKEIRTTTLNNDGYYTSVGTIGYERFDSVETKDKLFLLSYNEISNSNFGFDSSSSVCDAARQAQGSDYAKCQGLFEFQRPDGTYPIEFDWHLRSPGTNSYVNCAVHDSGRYCASNVAFTDVGVRPALRLRDIYNYNHQHSYNSVITDSTCTAQGFKTYTCECGDSYVSDYINAKGHKDDNSDYKCDYGCGYEYEKPSDPTEDCSCNCHAGGIKAFFFKMLNFFQKLFGKNKVCACGVKH